MPEEIDVDTKDLQDTIGELQEERKEREETERRGAWTRYIALTTALLAVFAAVAALRAGTLVNEAVSQDTSFTSSIGPRWARNTLFTSPSDATAMPSRMS